MEEKIRKHHALILALWRFYKARLMDLDSGQMTEDEFWSKAVAEIGQIGREFDDINDTAVSVINYGFMTALERIVKEVKPWGNTRI